MPRAKNKRVSQSKHKEKIDEAIHDQVDETVDYLVDDVVDDTDTESIYSESESENFDEVVEERSEENDKSTPDNSVGEIKVYTHDDKEVLVKRISRLHRDEHKAIRRIIKNHDPNKKKKRVAGGSYISFHNLDNTVYREIDKYLDEVSRKNKEEFQRYMSETENNLIISTEDPRLSSDIETSTKPRYRLSNREKHMLNRQRFDKIRSEEIQESIRMNRKEKKRADRHIDLTSSDKRTSRTINIGTSDINTVFDTLSHTEKETRNRNKTKRGKATVKNGKGKKGKNIFSKK